MTNHAFYMDVHVDFAITRGLRLRGVDVRTARADGRHRELDPQLLVRSTELNRILFTQDKGFLALARKLQSEGTRFFGVAYAPQQTHPVAVLIEDLVTFAQATSISEVENQVFWLPL